MNSHAFAFLFRFLPPPLGIRSGLFTPDRAFEQVAKLQIEKLKDPSSKLIDLVTHEMLATFKEPLTKVIMNSSKVYAKWHPERGIARSPGRPPALSFARLLPLYTTLDRCCRSPFRTRFRSCHMIC